MADIMAIVGGVRAAASIAKFLEFTASEISELKANEFDSAMRLLKDAEHSDREQQSLLQSAREHFNRAVGFEKHLRLAEAYLGLAMCHHHLGDEVNARRALEKITAIDVELGFFETYKANMRDVFSDGWGLILGPYPMAWRAMTAKPREELQEASDSQRTDQGPTLLDRLEAAAPHSAQLLWNSVKLARLKESVRGELGS